MFDVKRNDANVGKATDIIDFGVNVLVFFKKSLSAYPKKDGKRIYATEKIKGMNYFYHIADNYFLKDLRNSINIIYGIDMTNGEAKDSVQSKVRGGNPKYGDGIDITSDRKYIFCL